jgi:hypothetical protein
MTSGPRAFRNFRILGPCCDHPVAVLEYRRGSTDGDIERFAEKRLLLFLRRFDSITSRSRKANRGCVRAVHAKRHGVANSPKMHLQKEPLAKVAWVPPRGDDGDLPKAACAPSRASKDQRQFLEMLRNLGPCDNMQTRTVRTMTKRACQVRGWVEWRPIDGFPGVSAWHLTIIGREVLKSVRA